MKKRVLTLICALSFLSGGAATFTVTSNADSGPGSLRQALIDAAPGDNINFAITGVITVSSYLDISKDVHILGPGANLLAIDGGGTTQIFKDGNYTLNPVEIAGLEIRNGKGASYGGAIAGLGYNLTIRNCDIHNNTLTASYGGAISVWSVGASLTIQNSTLHDNSSSTYAGCIYLQDGADLTITNSTLFHNTGSAAGQAIYASGGNISLTNVTIAGHTNGSSAISLQDDFGNNAPCHLTMLNCIVDNPINNYSFSTSNGGTQTSLGHNINDDNSMSGFMYNMGDLNTTSAQLDPGGLQPNGGITPTVRPMCQSPAINNSTNALLTDQNGQAISGGARDIGAYETNYTPPVVVAHFSAPGTCEGDANMVYGTGAATYFWDNGVTDNIPFYPLATATYNVIGTDVNGCTGTDFVTITVELTTGFTAGPDMDVCRTTPMVSLNGNSPSGNTISWTTLGSGSFVNGSTLTPDYFLSAADSLADSVAIAMEVTYTYCANHVDTLVLYLKDPAFSYAGGDLNGCANEATGITVNGTALAYSSVSWTSLSGGVFTSPSTPFSFYNASPPEISAGLAELVFTVNALNPACPAVASDTMKIFLNTPPTFSLGPDYTICETDSVQLQTGITGGTGALLYNWSNGSTTISTANNEYYTPSGTENISLYVTDQYACYGRDTVVVTVDASETLTGTMHVGAGVLTDGTLYMLKFVPQQMVFDTLFIQPFSAGSGSFTFNSFPHGDYLIKIVPDTNLFPNLLPTYYGDAFQWDSAIVINHNCTNPFTADINMIQLLGGTGSGSISGFVLEDVGFGSRFGHGNDHIMVPGGPLKGIDVKLGKNPGGGIQARTMTDTTGHYAFEDLPNDSYRIYVDIPGLPMDSFYVVTINTASDTAINLNYYADSNSVFPILPTTVGLPSHSYAAANMDVYPNPAKDYTSLRFEAASQGTATIRLLDITGKTIQTTQLRNLPKGKHEYQLNFADLQSGIYFIEVQSGEGTQVKKLVVE